MQVIKILADDYVIEMHTNSGLLDAIEQARAADEEALNALSYEGELALAETKILHIMKTIGDDDTIFVISGNTIGFDKSYLEEYMPALFDALHYRQLDVSSYKVGFPEIFGTATSDAHRAMPDVRASIEQHRKMRKLIEDAWRYGELSR
jgi:oligoribonuclease